MSRNVHFSVSRQYITLNRVLFIGALCVVIYNQFFCFIISALMWPNLPLTRRQDEDLRILLVADPQLIGLRDEPRLLGYITRWDSDRYLRLCFYQAFGHVRPHVVIFLGDLLDEGSLASDEEFTSYIQRFNTVFQTPTHIQNIFIPGDNDVGGEGIDVKEAWKLNRFRRYFNRTSLASPAANDDITTVMFVDFFKLSFDFGERIKDSLIQKWSDMSQQSRAKYRVICNHMALLRRSPTDYGQIVNIMKPDLIITAHSHLAQLYKCLDCRSPEVSASLKQPLPPWIGQVSDLTNSDPLTFNLSDMSALHELVVPTCSYRMGVPDMGFGAAVLRKDGSLTFSVLWLPSRYHQLASYVIVVIIVFLLLIIRSGCVSLHQLIQRPTNILPTPSTFKYS
jgi:predicted phosphodiesterase